VTKTFCELISEHAPCAEVFLLARNNIVYFLYDEPDFVVVEKTRRGYQATETFDCRTQRCLARQPVDQNAENLVLEGQKENLVTVDFLKCRVTGRCNEGSEEREDWPPIRKLVWIDGELGEVRDSMRKSVTGNRRYAAYYETSAR
jgi:hypothetical protein